MLLFGLVLNNLVKRFLDRRITNLNLVTNGDYARVPHLELWIRRVCSVYCSSLGLVLLLIGDDFVLDQVHVTPDFRNTLQHFFWTQFSLVLFQIFKFITWPGQIRKIGWNVGGTQIIILEVLVEELDVLVGLINSVGGRILDCRIETLTMKKGNGHGWLLRV